MDDNLLSDSPPGSAKSSSLSPSRKRSRDAMERRVEVVSRTATEIAGGQGEVKAIDSTQMPSSVPDPTQDSTATNHSTETIKPSTMQQSMGPPPSKSTMAPPPPRQQAQGVRGQKTNPELKGEAGGKSASTGPMTQTRAAHQQPEEPMKQTRTRSDSDRTSDSQRSSESGSDSSVVEDPADLIDNFDWDDLHQRYHQRMEEIAKKEASIWTDFNNLSDFFAVWAATSHNHETDRSFKRLKTQTVLVQHHEQELEQKRQHYVRVVGAFKSALSLFEGE